MLMLWMVILAMAIVQRWHFSALAFQLRMTCEGLCGLFKSSSRCRTECTTGAACIHDSSTHSGRITNPSWEESRRRWNDSNLFVLRFWVLRGHSGLRAINIFLSHCYSPIIRVNCHHRGTRGEKHNYTNQNQLDFLSVSFRIRNKLCTPKTNDTHLSRYQIGTVVLITLLQQHLKILKTRF